MFCQLKSWQSVSSAPIHIVTWVIYNWFWEHFHWMLYVSASAHKQSDMAFWDIDKQSQGWADNVQHIIIK